MKSMHTMPKYLVTVSGSTFVTVCGPSGDADLRGFFSGPDAGRHAYEFADMLNREAER